MALQYVGGNTGTWAGATTGTNTVSLTALTGGLSSSAAAGDLVIAVYATGSTTDRTLSITDGTNAYTLVSTEQYVNGTTYDTNLRVAYKYLTGADASTTFGPTGNNADAGAAAVHVWRGVDSGNILDVAATPATGTGTGRPDPPASITPVTTGAVIVCCGGAAAQTGATFTSSDLSNFRTATSSDTNDGMVGIGSYAWTSGTFDAASWTGGTTNAADSWAAVTLALRPAPVNLTGQAGTATSGTLSGAQTVALSGSAATATQGSLTGEISASLSGSEGTATTGTITGETGASLSGSAATATSGTLGAEVSALDVRVYWLGFNTDAAPSIYEDLTGQEATAASGTLTASTAIALTGQDGQAVSGTLSPELSAALSGQDVQASVGSLEPTATLALSGQQATVFCGVVVPTGAVLLLGAGATCVAGTATVAFDCSLAGQAVSAASGQVTFAGDGTVGLVGQEALAFSGELTPVFEYVVEITGEEAVSYAGAVWPSISTSELASGNAVASSGVVAGAFSVAVAGSVVIASPGAVAWTDAWFEEIMQEAQICLAMSQVVGIRQTIEEDAGVGRTVTKWARILR